MRRDSSARIVAAAVVLVSALIGAGIVYLASPSSFKAAPGTDYTPAATTSPSPS